VLGDNLVTLRIQIIVIFNNKKTNSILLNNCITFYILMKLTKYLNFHIMCLYLKFKVIIEEV